MDLSLFKKLCCFFFFRAIFCKVSWPSTYKADFRNYSFKLFPSKKLPFLLPKRFFLFLCIMSPFSKIFFEMISFLLWTGTIFLISLYLQVFSSTIVFQLAMDLVNFGKKFSLITELFQGNQHIPNPLSHNFMGNYIPSIKVAMVYGSHECPVVLLVLSKCLKVKDSLVQSIKIE